MNESNRCNSLPHMLVLGVSAEDHVAIAIDTSARTRFAVVLRAADAHDRAQLAEQIELRGHSVRHHEDGVSIYYGEIGWMVRLEGPR